MAMKKVGVVVLAALTVLGGAVVNSTSVDARPFHRGGGWGHHGGFGHHGGWGHRGGWHGGGWIGPAIVGGLALGALAASPHYYGGGPYYGYGRGCVLERRVRHTPYGPVVRRVRVCY